MHRMLLVHSQLAQLEVIYPLLELFWELAHGFQLLFFLLEFLNLGPAFLDELLLAIELFFRGNVLDQQLIFIVALFERHWFDIGIWEVYPDLT